MTLRGFSEILAKKQALDAARPIPAEIVEPLVRWFEFEMTWAEQALEGGRLSREEVGWLIERGAADDGSVSRAGVLTLNCHRAVQLVGELTGEDNQGLSEERIQHLHRCLRAGLGTDGGRYRSGEARLAGGGGGRTERNLVEDGILPRADKVPILMNGFGRWYSSVDPGPETALETHFRIVRIQPFSYGNYAVGRMLMTLVLGRAGYPPIVIPPDLRDEYLESLFLAVTAGDKSDWRDLMMGLLSESLDACLVAAAKSLADVARRPADGP